MSLYFKKSYFFVVSSLYFRTVYLTFISDLQGIKKFDVVISEPIDCNGLIKDNFVEDMATIKYAVF